MKNDRLAKAVHAMPGPVFVALDGGQFDDLPAALAQADVKARSLFLGQANVDSERYGPWFADTYSAASLDRLLDLLGDKPAAVFWSYPPGEAALFAHLRRLNSAMVPLPSERDPTQYELTRALFRHWDPRVLLQVLPVLDEDQFARVFGAAKMLVMPDETGRVVDAEPHRADLGAPTGQLRLTVAQMQTLTAVRAEDSRRRIARFLTEHPPIDGKPLKQAEALDMARASEASGRALGLETEQGLGRWAYLMMMTRGRAAQVPEVRAYLTAPGARPDDRVQSLLAHTATALRQA